MCCFLSFLKGVFAVWDSGRTVSFSRDVKGPVWHLPLSCWWQIRLCPSPVPLPASESTPSPSFRSPALLSVGVCGIYLGIVASSSVPVPSHVYGLGAARPLCYLSFLRHLANSSGSPPAVLPVYLPFHPPPSGDSASPPAGQELGERMAVPGWEPRRGS